MNDGSFRSALDEHLAALQERDIVRFAATLGEQVMVVDGAGRLLEGREVVVRSHADWFASPDRWTFRYSVRNIRDFGCAAFALIEVAYQQSSAAAPVEFLLLLVFERTPGGAWRFVYDQNTPLVSRSD
jgi:ketosteroid isomerase-like protein